MSRFAKGMIPSPAHRVGLGDPLHLSAVAMPTSASVPIPPPIDQGGLGSCTGNSSAMAIQVEMARALGKPNGPWPELPSRLFLYFHARAEEGTTDQDAGAMISDIFDAAAKLGFPPESAWSYPDANASDDAMLAKATAQPDWNAYRRAADQRFIQGAHRITSTGQARADDVARAIAAGSVVVWGTDLDQQFEDLTPSQTWGGVHGPVIGGHAMFLHKYETLPDGARRYMTRSSWGDWCDNGSAWVAQSAITSSHASDFWVVSLAPHYSEVA